MATSHRQPPSFNVSIHNDHLSGSSDEKQKQVLSFLCRPISELQNIAFQSPFLDPGWLWRLWRKPALKPPHHSQPRTTAAHHSNSTLKNGPTLPSPPQHPQTLKPCFNLHDMSMMSFRGIALTTTSPPPPPPPPPIPHPPHANLVFCRRPAAALWRVRGHDVRTAIGSIGFTEAYHGGGTEVLLLAPPRDHLHLGTASRETWRRRLVLGITEVGKKLPPVDRLGITGSPHTS